MSSFSSAPSPALLLRGVGGSGGGGGFDNYGLPQRVRCSAALADGMMMMVMKMIMLMMIVPCVFYGFSDLYTRYSILCSKIRF